MFGFKSYFDANIERYTLNIIDNSSRAGWVKKSVTGLMLSYFMVNHLKFDEYSFTIYISKSNVDKFLEYMRSKFDCLVDSIFESNNNDDDEIYSSRSRYYRAPEDTDDFCYNFIDYAIPNLVSVFCSYSNETEFFEVSLNIYGGNVNGIVSDISSLDYITKTINDNNKSYVYMLLANNMGQSLNPIKVDNCPFVVDNYSCAVNKEYQYIKDNFASETPNGRIVIISGPPGTGKTYFIRNLITEVKSVSYIFIPAKFAGEIDSPSLVSLLFNHKNNTNKPIVLIIEDADTILEKRNDLNLAVISSLLNYTDGIVGSSLNLHVIATSNAENITFDEAITRSGRLLTNFSIGKLGVEHCNKWLADNGSDQTTSVALSLADLYAIIKNAKRTEIKKVNKIGF